MVKLVEVRFDRKSGLLDRKKMDVGSVLVVRQIYSLLGDLNLVVINFIV